MQGSTPLRTMSSASSSASIGQKRRPDMAKQSSLPTTRGMKALSNMQCATNKSRLLSNARSDNMGQQQPLDMTNALDSPPVCPTDMSESFPTIMSRTSTALSSASIGQQPQLDMTQRNYSHFVDLTADEAENIPSVMSRMPSGSSSTSTAKQLDTVEQPLARPLDLSGDNPKKILTKLRQLRRAAESSSLSYLVANCETIPVGIDSSAPFMGTQNRNQRQTSWYASTATKVSRPVSEASFGTTLVFNSENGETTTEKAKKSLQPVMKARKDLFRTLGKCGLDCREKKVKCWISHHRIKDLLKVYPEAEEDVLWALGYDTDPKQQDRVTGSGAPPLLARSTSHQLYTHTEEDEKTQIIDRASNLLGIDDPPRMSYATNLVLDQQNDDGTFEEFSPQISGNMTHSFQPSQMSYGFGQGVASTGDYQINIQTPQGIDPRRLRQNPCQQRNDPSNFRINSPQQPMFADCHMASYASQEYPSALQSQTYGAPNTFLANVEAPALAAEVILAWVYILGPRNVSVQCLVPDCGAAFCGIRQATNHLREAHRGFEMLPEPRAACSGCGAIYLKSQRLCQKQGCPRQLNLGMSSLQLALCGIPRRSSSQLRSPLDMDMGMDMHLQGADSTFRSNTDSYRDTMLANTFAGMNNAVDVIGEGDGHGGGDNGIGAGDGNVDGIKYYNSYDWPSSFPSD